MEPLDSTWLRFYQRGLRVARLFRILPFVRMVGLNGSMVTGSFQASSDIDLLVVAEPGHIFTVRLLTALVTSLLGVKRTAQHVAGRICLNRYCVTNFLEITPHNQYHAAVFYNQFPLFASTQLVERYSQDNAWMEQFNYLPQLHKPALEPTIGTRAVQGFAEYLLGSRLEQLAKRWQIKRVAEDPRSGLAGSVVVLLDTELRFHLAK